jgi:hypothetical protein
MRLLGNNSSLSTFRWDLIYLLAQLLSDDRPGVSDLAAPIQKRLDELATRRTKQEAAEDWAITAGALVVKTDRRRDGVLVEAGGVARAAHKQVYATLFPRHNPSQTARLGVEAESAEVTRILSEMGKLPDQHPIRVAYEAELSKAETAVAKAVHVDGDDGAGAGALGDAALQDGPRRGSPDDPRAARGAAEEQGRGRRLLPTDEERAGRGRREHGRPGDERGRRARRSPGTGDAAERGRGLRQVA